MALVVVVVGGGVCHGQRSRPSTWPGGPDYRGQVHPYDLGLSTSPKVEGGGGGGAESWTLSSNVSQFSHR